MEMQTWEFVLLPIYIAIIFFFAYRFGKGKRLQLPGHGYFIWGLAAKIFGAIAFVLIYIYYYKGGDTISYYQSSMAFANLFERSPSDFFHVLFSEASMENRSYFDINTGYPLGYMYFDTKTFTVIRLVSPILILSFKSYLLSTVVLSSLSYYGIWKLYTMLVEYFPKVYKQLALTVIFMPSMIFWGSGLLKDTFTLSATCLLVYSINELMIKRRFTPGKIFGFLIGLYVLISIKPYIFMVLLPCALLWIAYTFIKQTNFWMNYVVVPLVTLLVVGGSLLILNSLGNTLSKFALDQALETVVVTQQDLKSDYYGGNSFDIGDFDASIGGVASKFPIATASGLYRPGVWESRSVVMMLSGLENLFLLILTAWVLVKVRWKLLKLMFTERVVFFMLIFAVLFAFVIGISTSNFGALVRFKIPLLPFFPSALFILLHLHKQQSKRQLTH